MTSAAPAAPRRGAGRRNPYVGPRAFRNKEGELFFGREREKRELTDLLIAERIVLLHAPSGAGKTSLVQAGLVPLLRKERLGKDHFAPTIPLRVKTPVPDGLRVRNRYIYSIALDLLGGDHDPKDLAGLDLPEVIKLATQRPGAGVPVLIFDQFEEILLLEPGDWQHQRAFFRELGAALNDSRIWALLSMREEYIGGLDRFVRYLPTHLRTTFRLDFLEKEPAMTAITAPAARAGVTYTDEAAAELLRRLMTRKVQRPCHGVEEVMAPYVGPFQLQVVCRRLWWSLVGEKGPGFDAIDLDDVERHGDVETALSGYFSDAVAGVARTTRADEQVIRDWFETQLITVQHFRNQTLAGPVSGDVEPTEVLRALEDAYLVRSDTRAESTWYELAHDQLITPVLESNRAWRRVHLEPWRRRARDWNERHDDSLLLRGPELRDAEHRANGTELTQPERDFLQASGRVEQDRNLLQQLHSTIGTLGVIAVVELVVIVVLLVQLLRRS
jgi:hypothetical protein